MRILIADDHDIIRDGLVGLLVEAGHEVVGQAKNGLEAVKLAAKLLPDVLVIDIGMPGLNGVDATTQIVSQKPAPFVIAMSMHSDRTYVNRMLKAGARGYLLKECASEELAKAIQVVVDGKVHLSPAIAGVADGDFVGRGDSVAPAKSPVLTKMERQVLQMVAEGQSSKEIANVLFLSVKTIETHRYNLMKRLGIRSIAQLTKFAIRHGITLLDN